MNYNDKKVSAESVLEYMIPLLLLYLEELMDCNRENNPFAYGERTAYTECLEMIQAWDKAASMGLDFDIEAQYPL